MFKFQCSLPSSLLPQNGFSNGFWPCFFCDYCLDEKNSLLSFPIFFCDNIDKALQSSVLRETLCYAVCFVWSLLIRMKLAITLKTYSNLNLFKYIPCYTLHLFSNRSQIMSKCGKNKTLTHEAIAEFVTDFLTTYLRLL